MWLKVLSLLILCALSLSVQASPFGHQSVKTSQIETLSSTLEQGYSQTRSLTFTEFNPVCINQEPSPPELECCHIDTCSALILNDIKEPSFVVFLDSHPVLSSWPYKPISALKKPPKITVV